MNHSIVTPLKNRNFRHLFISQVISDIGTWFDMTAIIVLLAYHWNLGAVSIAIYTVSIGLPWVIFGPFAGVFVDKLPKKTVMILSDVFRGILVLFLLIAPNLYFVVLIMVCKGLFSALFEPAKQTSIKLLLSDDQLLSANSLSQLSFQGSRIIGPALGSLLLVFSTPQTAFVIDGISFFISALILFMIPLGKYEKHLSTTNVSEMDQKKKKLKTKVKDFSRDFKEGIQYILSNKILIILILYITGVNFVIFLFESLAVLLAKEMEFSEESIGLFMSVSGLGAVAGAIMTSRLGSKMNQFSLMIYSSLFLSVILSLVGLGGFGILPPNLILWLIVWFLMGLFLAVISVCYGTLLQVNTPTDLMGRVSSTASAFGTTALVVAPLLGSFLAQWIQIGGVFILSGLIMLAICLTSFIYLQQNNVHDVSPNVEQV
ncbi:MFS transporter [Chengkuizengella axinellae]|uniref:MFS transporter n=1 Tax=Chengkuizengella axinellae TaxID=3064388 RepID=A0ABT9J2Y3_9BACL|nr:MFS transporter [Chengkuizengella sp. 2205SS18-9]MDP5275354.1 MFS transporter [Chengkuizengella sp. 2205SS18-9]